MKNKYIVSIVTIEDESKQTEVRALSQTEAYDFAMRLFKKPYKKLSITRKKY